MTPAIQLTIDALKTMLSHYDLGDYVTSRPLSAGSVQTNIFIETTTGQFVLKYYTSRSLKSVGFEANLLVYILKRDFPCAAPMRTKNNTYVTLYEGHPFILFEFIQGEHVETLSDAQKHQIITIAATLQNYTKVYSPQNRHHRWNYDPEFLQQYLDQKRNEITDANFKRKAQWYQMQLDSLQIESRLPKSVCHCDYHYTNILWDGDKLIALIDFDDANRTYRTFDLIYLIDMWSWSDDKFDLERARKIITIYTETRPLDFIEKRLLYEIHRLKILVDSIWFFHAGDPDDYPGKRHMEGLQAMGYDTYTQTFFGDGFSL